MSFFNQTSGEAGAPEDEAAMKMNTPGERKR